MVHNVPMRLVLASASPARLATLIAAGITPIVQVSTVDEDAILAALPGGRAFSGGTTTPADEVCALAAAKCTDVCEALSTPGTNAELPEGEGVLVVGCDSMLEIDGHVVGKPINAADASERWRTMSGSTGTLHTGHFLVRTADGTTAEGVSSATIRFGSPSQDEIEAYIASGEPLWCAGAFTIDGLGGAFIEGIDGDPHGVVGISLPLLRRLLAALGVVWTDLWAPPPATKPVDDAH